MKKILVTGGCGYLGSHTIVDLIDKGYDPICLDDNSRSTTVLLDGVYNVTGKRIVNNKIDLKDYNALDEFFESAGKIDGIIHFAAYKDVNESVGKPLMYMENNLLTLVNLLKCVEKYKVDSFIFSSSCSVYGNAKEMPVTEQTPLAIPESPYASTKKLGEEIIQEVATKSKTKFILLRYFNPAGAHPSIKIGEVPNEKPSNLIPAITFFAAGKLDNLNVFGGDYDTRDGSCVRDFVHVCDIASAHTLSLKYLENNEDAKQCSIYNLGTGDGVTILETLKTFEEVNNHKLSYAIIDRREGDVVAIFSDSNLAKKDLGWEPKYNIKDIMYTAWEWEKMQSKK